MAGTSVTKITRECGDEILSLEVEDGKEVKFMRDDCIVFEATLDDFGTAHSMLEDLDRANELFDNRFKLLEEYKH